MENKNFLDFNVGSQLRTVIVTNIEKREITTKEGAISNKIVLKVSEKGSRHKFDISDIWTDSSKGKKIKGLWLSTVDEKLAPNSAIATLLNFYKIGSLKEMIDKELLAYPDSRNFLVIVACDVQNEDELKQ